MKSFNLRVYGLLINERGEVLISDEYRDGHAYTKFPGGGLEWGEGLQEGLRREFLEELGIEIDVHELFYVNDFFLASAFNANHQLISFYFLVSYAGWTSIETDKHVFPLEEDGEKHRWILLERLNEEMFTFPIDKRVAVELARRERKS